ncbi:unnamed protein product (macronuclear) [Paramecium tetraurelia]|uniref:Uncharacterized protein n=1 Tax=Paramecium tetraurelia TaxID=5888 RepID=A0BR40_PARTE|nr:uncharacterized protein GSPATT00031236001 [Paramecium tetraurelia]CAK61007.1 unnamed protein product [Paramecium tetraurelia]|eukprot:XP_001428405.1 hypothetical protein (macronuclear) [Paramecium tetraurelia strain d4-2]
MDPHSENYYLYGEEDHHSEQPEKVQLQENLNYTAPQKKDKEDDEDILIQNKDLQLQNQKTQRIRLFMRQDKFGIRFIAKSLDSSVYQIPLFDSTQNCRKVFVLDIQKCFI